MNWPPANFTLNSGVWRVDGQVGNGNVGEVFKVSHTESGEIAAIKAVAVEGGDRDGLAAELSLAGVRSIVPIVETGSGDGMLLYRMPLAEKSLRDQIDDNPGPRPEAEVVAVLRDVATALVDMGSRVFHRDIKPDNVLLLEGVWCVADFGTARDQAVATATQTHNRAAMNAYTAPERWHLEPATAASDVYSLGVVAYEMLNGTRPFAGSDVAAYKIQHTTKLVPPLGSTTSVRVATLVERMLGKEPGQRPAPQHILDVLEQVREETPSPTTGADALRQVNLAAVRAREERAAADADRRRTEEQREALSRAAATELLQIAIELKHAVNAAASEAHHIVVEASALWSVGLLGAALRFGVDDFHIPRHRTEGAPFDVVANAQISLRLPPHPDQVLRGPGEFSHSLWYCNPAPGAKGSFGWYETAFATWESQLVYTDGRVKPRTSMPRAEGPTTPVIDALNGHGTGTVCVWPFELVAAGDLHGFIDRWLQWHAGATACVLPTEDHAAVLGKAWTYNFATDQPLGIGETVDLRP
ncbi:serine/threonine-protein kinase [Nocardia tengchongensis]|uniref:serine/threonine-protein kinase n=1 Tax=Nocardia tengchongensis TaxID=2055889 RepID=UPI0036A699E1